MTPSAIYDVDYTDGYGLKWTKPIYQLYPSVGVLDESIAYSKFDNDIMRTVFRKYDLYNTLYDDSITIGSMPGSATDVVKYYKRTGYPTADVNINTVIVNAATADGGAYSIGTEEETTTPLSRAYMSTYRLLCDAEYNKMLFNVRVREMSFTTHTNVIHKNTYDDPAYTDTNLNVIDESKYYAIFYHLQGKVWNGSDWSDTDINPALMCTGEQNQTFQGAGSVFNNTFTTYSTSPLGTGQNIDIFTQASGYYWTGENFQSKMNNSRYCLGLSDSFSFMPSWANNPQTVYDSIKQWLLDNSIPQLQSEDFEITRELIQISDHAVILYTESMRAYLDSNNDLCVVGSNVHTFPMMTGKAVNEFIAGFGLYYLTDENADLTGITPSNLGDCADIWLGEMSADGTTTGRWIKGSDIDSYTGYNKEGNIINPSYDPSSGGGGGSLQDKVDDMTLNPLFALSSDAGFASYWLMTSSQLVSFHNWLTTTAFPDGYDPYSYIISLIQFPLKLTNTWCLPGTGGSIHVGGEDTGINSNLIGNEKGYIGIGTYKVPRLQGNFLDYDPYSQYEVYIPCCGWVTVPDIVAGNTISCRINYDLTTAAIIGNVYVNIEGDWLLIASKSGMMGRETVVSGEAQGVRSAQIQSALFSAGTGAINVAAGLMSGNAVAAVSGTYSIAAGIAQANVANNSSYVRQIGSTGGRALLCQFDQCYCKITTSEADVPDNYGHTVGFICNRSGKVSSFSGFTIFENFDTSGIAGATETERAEIKRIMESGVIIK